MTEETLAQVFVSDPVARDLTLEEIKQRPFKHHIQLEIDFDKHEPEVSSQTAYQISRALSVDKELKPTLLLRTIKHRGNTLLVDFWSDEVRLLRVASNSFLDRVQLALNTVLFVIRKKHEESKNKETKQTM